MKITATNILKFLEFSQKLKSQERSIKISENRFESVADHSWHLAMMALVVESHLENRVDLLKVLKMILVHDLVEADIGDVSHGLTSTNEQTKITKAKLEREEIIKIKEMVGGELGEEIFAIWHEFENLETVEAKFVKALDSLEANFQSIMFDVGYWDDWFYKIALTKADKYCEHEKILTDINAEITNRMKLEINKAGIDLDKL